ncbi:MAG: peptidoglycan D,D-transpeptidase FtsI family protein [Actinomycetota bacterium]
MGARLFTLQILERSSYERLAARQRQRIVSFPARRGAIFDRNGRPLAISVDTQSVYTDPTMVTDIHSTARKLAPVLGLSPAVVEQRLHGTSPRFGYIARQLDGKTADKVKTLQLPGIYLRAEPKRYYPGGRLASQILGFTNIDGRGISGVELQYNDVLQGTPGTMTLEQDPAGRPLPQAKFSETEPVPGRSLLLTIDKELEYFTQLTLNSAVQRYHALDGTAIVMRPSTGEILALANAPDYDPNHPGAFPDADLRNQALTDIYEPGSAFKIVTASGALQSHIVTPRTRFTVPYSLQVADRTIHDAEGHGTESLSVKDIIDQSSNVGTVEIGLKLGKDRIDHYVRAFGFGSKTGLDFPGESAGIVIPKDEWSGSSIANIPIGQGVAVTPMQLITAYASLANGGRWVEPKLLHGTLDAAGHVHPAAPPATRRVVSRKTAAQMTNILEGVVTHGTGVAAAIPGYRVAGKTGTAQKPLPGGGYGNNYEASFVGYAPAEDPSIVVLVRLDDPTPIWGGYTAAPTFQAIAQFALRHLGVAPTGNAAKQAASEPSTTQGSIPGSGF